LEEEVFRSVRKQARSASDEIKVLNILYPSDKNALRLLNMEILVGLYDGLNFSFEEDGRNDGQKITEFQKEIELATVRAKEISNDPRIQHIDSGLVKDYETIIGDLEKLNNLILSFKKMSDFTLDSSHNQSSQLTGENRENLIVNLINLLETVVVKIVVVFH
jgi:hypothetical protein